MYPKVVPLIKRSDTQCIAVNCSCESCVTPTYVGIDVGERYALGITAFHRPSKTLKTLAINMKALNRPNRIFSSLLEKKKEQDRQGNPRENVFVLEQEMGRVQPSQMLMVIYYQSIN